MKPIQTTGDTTTIETLIVTGLGETRNSSLNKYKYIFYCKSKTFGHWTHRNFQCQMKYTLKIMCSAVPKTEEQFKL